MSVSIFTSEGRKDFSEMFFFHDKQLFFKWSALFVFVFYQLCAVYLFEYVAQGCASKVRPASEYNKGCPELFAALSFCYQVQVHGKTESLSTFWTLTQCSLVNLRYIYDALFCISYNTEEFQINRITYYTYVCHLHFSNICFRPECLCPGPRCNYSKSREWRFYQCYNF